MQTRKALLNSEQGMVLVITLLILALLIGAGVGAIVSTQTDLKTSSNLKTATQAFYIADAGINHARREMQDGDGTNDFDYVFATAATGAQVVSNSSFNGGTYTVTKEGTASNPSRVKVLSVGTAPNNARAELEVWFRKDAGMPPKAIETNGDLKISGNPSIMGTCGGAHTNDDMQISGSPSVQMADGLTGSNSPGSGGSLPEGMDISGTPCIGSAACGSNPQPEAYKLNSTSERNDYEAAHSSSPTYSLPTINPADYAPKVAALGEAGKGYLLNNDCTIRVSTTANPINCGADGLCSGGVAPATSPAGWTCSGGNWAVSGNSAANGVFYSEGQVKVSGNPGSSSTPWETTIIARDSITVSGNPSMKPYPTSSEELKNTQFVTGNDLELSGNPSAEGYQGAILVHQQFKLNGNPTIRGFIIAGDGQPTWTGDPFTNSNQGVTRNEISGNPSITYACDLGCTGPGCPPPTVGTASWAQKF